MSIESLPEGVRVGPLQPHRDSRGNFTELYREAWMTDARFIQWNAVNSEANVLRGVHVHRRHFDYLIMLRGRGLFGLKDLRQGSPTNGLSTMVELNAESPSALFIPPGVAHGFYFLEPSLHVYAVSEYWNTADELGCHFTDPGLGFTWPSPTPRLSERDRTLPPLAEILELIPPYIREKRS